MSFYRLYEQIRKEKLYLESLSDQISSLKDAIEFIGNQSHTDMSSLVGKVLDTQSWEIIKKAYKKIMLRWHPDKVAQDKESQQNAKDYSAAANFAFEKLEKAFKNQRPIDSSSININQTRNNTININELKDKMVKKLKTSFPENTINTKIEKEEIQAEFLVDSVTNPYMFEGLPITKSFSPVFHVFVKSTFKEWQAKITLHNKSNNQKLLEHTIKAPTKEEEIGMLAMLADYYDNIVMIEGFMEETIKKAVSRSPLEDLAYRIRRSKDQDIIAKNNRLVWRMKDIDSTKQWISARDDYWPSMSARGLKEILNSYNANPGSAKHKVFRPEVLTFTMELQESSISLTLSDKVLFKVFKTVPLSGLYDLKDKNWTSNILLNEVRKLITAIQNQYHKYEMELLRDYKGSLGREGRPRGFWGDEQKRYDVLSKEDPSIKVQKLAG